MSDNLSKKLTVYNFIFTICIVIYHWKNFNVIFSAQQTIVTDTLYLFYDTLGTIALGIFFMISGYLFYLGIDDKIKLFNKIKRRVSSLVVPFIVWNALMLVYKILYGIYSHDLNISVKDILLGFSFVPFDGPLWYMFALILLIGLSPFVLKLKDSQKIFLGIVVTVFVASYLWGVFVKSDSEIINWISRLIYYLPAYTLGCYFGLCKSDVVAEEKYNSKTVAIISILLSAFILVYFLFLDLKTDYINWILLHCLPITIWLSFSNKKFKKVKISYPMQITFFVYALHALLISLINTILTKFINYNSLHYVVSIITHLVLVIILYLICMCFVFFAKKILPPKLFAMISGGRTK